MYPMDVAEVVVLELVANSLDARSKRISLDYSRDEHALTIEDDGCGMVGSQFDQYHDFAAGLKARGSGIGFAGLGAKISFNIATEVRTETRSKSFSAGSRWYMDKSKRLVWEDFKPSRIQQTGTRVEVRFKPDTKVPYEDSAQLEELLRLNFLPLLDSKFLDLYDKLGAYSNQLRFWVNGVAQTPDNVKNQFSLDRVREFFPTRGEKRFGYGVFGLSKTDYPLGPDRCGVLMCTYGKVVKSEWFSQFPGSLGPRVVGIIEIPELMNFLTTAKTDFTFRGKRKQFETLYSPIRDEFKSWLKEIGADAVHAFDDDESRKLERELQQLLDQLPELADFASIPRRAAVLVAAGEDAAPAGEIDGSLTTFPAGPGNGGDGPSITDVGQEGGVALTPDVQGRQKAKPISRTSRRGPKITIVMAPDRPDLGWVEGNIVFINRAHPSFGKTRSNPAAQRLHSVFAIATAIQRHLALDDEKRDLFFVDRMMAAWGRQ